MIHEIWLISLGAVLPTAIALFAGKSLAARGAIFPVLATEKAFFFLATWFFVSLVSVLTYVITEMMGLDKGTQHTVAGFFVPVIAGAVFVRIRLGN